MMHKQITRLAIPKMDCASEEQMVRMALGSFETIESIRIDLDKREAELIHQESDQDILHALMPLKLGTQLLFTKALEEGQVLQEESGLDRKILWQVLAINAGFFVIEEVTSLLFQSLGIAADGLDMLADSLVYAMALYAVGSSLARQKMVSRLAGYFQLFLALIGFINVFVRVTQPHYLPNVSGMFLVSLMALLANSLAYYIIAKSKNQGLHMKASKIFTSNDILINLGLMLTSLLVAIFQSPIPDLIIGFAIFVLVVRGAFKIISLSR